MSRGLIFGGLVFKGAYNRDFTVCKQSRIYTRQSTTSMFRFVVKIAKMCVLALIAMGTYMAVFEIPYSHQFPRAASKRSKGAQNIKVCETCKNAFM